MIAVFGRVNDRFFCEHGTKAMKKQLDGNVLWWVVLRTKIWV